MKKIEGRPKTLLQLLTGVKYTIHYYQREYRWGKKQIEELIEDLSGEFLEHYDPDHERREVERYGHYFLGSIIITHEGGENAIIDGQQRLTSLTLLLMYMAHQLTGDDQAEVQKMIYSTAFGKKSFNIDVPERAACLEALYNGRDFDPTEAPESVQNMYARYRDIEDLFPEGLRGAALPCFKDWLIHKVELIEITAATEQDAHKIFVSMNDRGLSLTPTEMLKGFLLSEIADNEPRKRANDLWKQRILELKALGKEEDADFLKTWLRARYAADIREGGKDTVNLDWDLIGTTFHKWVSENTSKIGLVRAADYEHFVLQLFMRYSKVYVDLVKRSTTFDPRFPYVFYNADRNFTLQYQLILAAINEADDPAVIDRKVHVVSCFVDQFITRRVVNYKSVDYSSIKRTVFVLTKKVRGLSIDDLTALLTQELSNMEFTLEGIDRFRLNVFTKRFIRHMLARITHHIEERSEHHTLFANYVDRERANNYDIEHIWADHYTRYQQWFANEEDFERTRDSFGGLLLLPKDKNRSYSDMTYEEKLPKYFAENLLCRTLNDQCYQNHPGFLRYVSETGLPFKAYPAFGPEEMKERQELYKKIAKQIWRPEQLCEFSL
jgi:hypothetical protein